MKQLIDNILNHSATKSAKNFLNSQTWETLKKKEIVLSYDDLTSQLNSSLEKKGAKINSFTYTTDKQMQILATHKELGELAVNLTLHNFCLLPKKAQVVFTPEVKQIKALPDAGVWQSSKAFFANLITTNFSETLINKMFNKKTFEKNIHSSVDGGKVTIDFYEHLKNTELGKTFLGFSALDVVQITNIEPNVKGLGVQFNIYIPQWVKTLAFILITALVRKILTSPSKSAKTNFVKSLFSLFVK